MIAKGIGRSHRLGLPISNAEDLSSARSLISSPDEDEEGNPLYRSYFFQKGFSEREVDDTYRKADEIERCGFLLGISPTIQGTNGLSLIKGDSGEGDVAIRTFGRGLPYRLISGIEPLGDAEKEYLAGLYARLRD